MSREPGTVCHHRPAAVHSHRQTAARTGTVRVRPEGGSMRGRLINVVVAGLGGQGVLKASDILADVALRAGFDVKKSEIKGMSQRGGSVTSDVRFGQTVLS